MVKVVAAAALLLFVILTAADPLLCPDGCSTGQQAGSPSHPGACLSCQHGIAAPEITDPLSTPTLVKSDRQDILLLLVSPALHAIEHPPRFA